MIFHLIFVSEIKNMSYRDIIKGVDNSKLEVKEKLVPVFSDIVGRTESEGLGTEFIENTEENLESTSAAGFYLKIFNNSLNKGELEKALMVYESEFLSRKKWITLMGLLERKIFQYRCLRKPNLAISLQEQKSGENKFKYILLRTQFMTLFEGKKELRVYLKKLEDYPGFNSLDELKKSESFINAAYEAIRNEMREIMNTEGVSLEYITGELKKIDFKSEQQLVLQFEEEIRKKRDQERRQRYDERNERIMSQFNEEQKEEIEKHKLNLKMMSNPVDREKEKSRHKEEMDRLRKKKRGDRS